MTEKFIAKAVKGREFLFSLSSAIAVPKTSAQKIADTLNNLKYRLGESEVWHVYDNDSYYNDYISDEIKRYSDTKMKVYRYHG